MEVNQPQDNSGHHIRIQLIQGTVSSKNLFVSFISNTENISFSPLHNPVLSS